MECLRSGKKESAALPQRMSIVLIKTLDRVRQEGVLVYAQDQ